MAILDLVTKDDLEELRRRLIQDLKEVIQANHHQQSPSPTLTDLILMDILERFLVYTNNHLTIFLILHYSEHSHLD